MNGLFKFDWKWNLNLEEKQFAELYSTFWPYLWLVFFFSCWNCKILWESV